VTGKNKEKSELKSDKKKKRLKAFNKNDTEISESNKKLNRKPCWKGTDSQRFSGGCGDMIIDKREGKFAAQFRRLRIRGSEWAVKSLS